MKIAIQSKRILPFDPVSRIEGIVRVEIDLYQRTKTGWYLRLIDTCFYEVTENDGDKSMKVQKETQNIRDISYPAEFLNNLAVMADAKNIVNNETFAGDLDRLFQIGLLALTQMECRENKGIYFSNEDDWELVNEA